jgi:protocatechuate 3,4-dioxygenase beta subunit
MQFNTGLFLFVGAISSLSSSFCQTAIAQDEAADPSACASQETAPAPLSPRFDEVEVTGTVFNPDDSPAVGAAVSTRVADLRSTTVRFQTISVKTDQKGRFAFVVHHDQLANLALIAVGEEPKFQGYSKSPFSESATREFWKEITIQLQDANLVVATVLDPEGAPAPGANIWLQYQNAVSPVNPFTTDEKGQAQLWIPPGLSPDSGFAALDGVGVDYTTFRKNENVNSPRAAEPVIEDVLELRLARLIEITVKVVDEEGTPLADASVHPSFRRPGRREFLLRPEFVPQWLVQQTNEKGEAILLAPSDVDEPVSVYGVKRGYLPTQMTGRRFSGNTNQPSGFLWDPAKPGPVSVVMRDLRTTMVTLIGHVVDPNGKAVPHAAVVASGQGFVRPNPFHKDATYTDVDGRFSLSLCKNSFYVLLVETGNHLAAQRSFTIGDVAPADPLVIDVAPGRAITIRAIDAETAQPAASAPIQVSFTTHGQYQRRFVAGEEMPKLRSEQQWLGGLTPSAYVYRGNTNEKGEVNLFLPDGQYEAISFADGPIQDERIFLVSEAPMEVELLTNYGGLLPAPGIRGKAASVARLPFKGIILDDKGNPLPGAKVSLGSRIMMTGIEGISTATDLEGEFELDRDPRVTMLRAVSPDKFLSGMAMIPTNAKEWTLKLAPAPRVTGQLLDSKTKVPLVGKKVEAARGGRNWSEGASVSATTDSEGRFVLSPLFPGTFYKISHTEGELTDFRNYSSTTVAYGFLDAPGQILDLKAIYIAEEE